MFKQSFKYYKSKVPLPKCDEVLIIDNSGTLLNNGLIDVLHIDKKCGPQYGLKKSEDWEVFTIKSHNGLIFIKNPFTPNGQRYWIKRCLNDYSKKPCKLNIDSLNILTCDKEWWNEGQTNNKIITSLRWSTFGYHHNWDTKIYSRENWCPFPTDMKDLTEHVANQLGFDNFSAEAAIVNYYHLDSTLSGHTDHSEQNLEAPLFSFSFGQSAIFLIGGKTLDEKPIALFINSGDILIMSKDSRLCYHAVPKIVKTDCEVWNNISELPTISIFSVANDTDWEPYSSYLSYSRININVRQVLNVGQFTL